jgi:hypothetical protein
MASGLFCGMYLKLHAVVYSPPEWRFRVVEIEADKLQSLERRHNRMHFRLVAASSFLSFFIPSILVVGIATLPYYATELLSGLGVSWPLVSALAVGLTFSISVYGAFRATSNTASSDFSLRLIREALWLAQEQGKVRGVAHATVQMEAADDGDLRIFRFPRVALGIEGLEGRALIQSWSDELRAISKIRCSFNGSDGKASALWDWHAETPFFVRKAEDEGKEYYVRFPVPSGESEIGVKDVRLLTENAVALVCLEALRVGGQDSGIEAIVRDLHAGGSQARDPS